MFLSISGIYLKSLAKLLDEIECELFWNFIVICLLVPVVTITNLAGSSFLLPFMFRYFEKAERLKALKESFVVLVFMGLKCS